ncbi:hypothetical protein ACF3OC_08485 [Sphingobacterium cellulitidis]|uniref:hypothetical protein n=1 Tax=Sphingobacterium cellulitidis TaxID=1768011 RepID=UPI000B93C458|nr:hypothetical protein CHT99_10390 [Sphingobacterium cellulitidis]
MKTEGYLKIFNKIGAVIKIDIAINPNLEASLKLTRLKNIRLITDPHNNIKIYPTIIDNKSIEEFIVPSPVKRTNQYIKEK